MTACFIKTKLWQWWEAGIPRAADAMLLSRVARKVYLIHRRDSLRASKVYHDPLMKAERVEFLWNTTVSGLIHTEKLTGVNLKNVQTGEESDLALDGLFISIGRAPETGTRYLRVETGLFAGQIALDDQGYIAADETTRTSLPGVFAVGDVRTKPMRQIVTAVGDGAVAALYAEEYLSGGTV